MLRVTIELLPGGREARKKVLGWFELSNISELADISDYAFHGSIEPGGRDRVVQGHILQHARASGWLPLVIRLLQRVGRE